MNHLINSLKKQLKSPSPNNFKKWEWLISMAQNCSTMDQLYPLHATFITHGLHKNTFAVSNLLSFCALSETGSLKYASQLFDQLPQPNTFIFNTLIRAYSRSAQPHKAIHYFNAMLDNMLGVGAFGVVVNSHTFPFVIIACANLGWMVEGVKIHCWVLKNGLGSFDCHVQTALLRLYVSCKALGDARKIFDEIVEKDAVHCNVLISGYFKCDMAMDSLEVFRNMMVMGIEPDEFCVTTGLAACSKLGALEQGKWIHEYVRKRNMLVKDVFVGTALVDMYAKCGSIEKGLEVFESMPRRNAVSWAAIIGGLGTHGDAKRAIELLRRMYVADNIRPDGVVLLGVLTACAHAGLHREGLFLLDKMEELYGVRPGHEHYSCVVDMLSKAGKLDDSVNVIRRMPMKPQASVWGALLSGSRIHNNVILAEVAVKELLLLGEGNEDEEDAAYVQLSYIYLASQRCDDARKVRKMIGDKGFKKTAGGSAIEVDGEVHEFVSGESSHPHLAKIHGILKCMSGDSSLELLMSRAQPSGSARLGSGSRGSKIGSVYIEPSYEPTLGLIRVGS